MERSPVQRKLPANGSLYLFEWKLEYTKNRRKKRRSTLSFDGILRFILFGVIFRIHFLIEKKYSINANTKKNAKNISHKWSWNLIAESLKKKILKNKFSEHFHEKTLSPSHWNIQVKIKFFDLKNINAFIRENVWQHLKANEEFEK